MTYMIRWCKLFEGFRSLCAKFIIYYSVPCLGTIEAGARRVPARAHRLSDNDMPPLANSYPLSVRTLQPRHRLDLIM